MYARVARWEGLTPMLCGQCHRDQGAPRTVRPRGCRAGLPAAHRPGGRPDDGDRLFETEEDRATGRDAELDEPSGRRDGQAHGGGDVRGGRRRQGVVPAICASVTHATRWCGRSAYGRRVLRRRPGDGGVDGPAAARVPARGRHARGRAGGRRPLVRRLSRAPHRVRRARRLPRRGRRARARVRRAPTPRSCASTRRGSSTSRASASCRWTTRAAAAAPAPTRPTTATSTPTARTPGERATVFTRVLRRGGRTYIQYWLYYPDSNTTWAGSDGIWERSTLLPLVGKVRARDAATTRASTRTTGRATSVRIDPDGRVWARASSHGHYQGCKEATCRNRWMRASGWTRVSRGSHAGHIPGGSRCFRGRASARRCPGVDLRERTSTAGGPAADPARDARPGGYRPRDDERHAAVAQGGVPGARERRVMSAPASAPAANRLERRMSPAYASFGRSPERAPEPS